MACQRRVWPTNGVIMFLFWNRFSLSLSLSIFTFRVWFVGLAYQGKGIVFRIIIEYSSLRDMDHIITLGNNRSIFIWGFLKLHIFGLCWNLRLVRVIMTWRILVSFRGYFWRLYFWMVKYLSFHNSSFALRYFYNANGKVTVWHTPLLIAVGLASSLGLILLLWYVFHLIS